MLLKVADDPRYRKEDDDICFHCTKGLRRATVFISPVLRYFESLCIAYETSNAIESHRGFFVTRTLKKKGNALFTR